MSAIITGEFLILLPESHAVCNALDGTYKFYYVYKAQIPVASLADLEEVTHTFTDSSEIEDCTLFAEIWMPIPSPALPFPHRSLVYLRGRLILPLQEIDDDAIFTFYIEVISAQFREVAPPSLGVAGMHHRLGLNLPNRPEVLLSGKILHISTNDDYSAIILLEVKEQIGYVLDSLIITYDMLFSHIYSYLNTDLLQSY